VRKLKEEAINHPLSKDYEQTKAKTNPSTVHKNLQLPCVKLSSGRNHSIGQIDSKRQRKDAS